MSTNSISYLFGSNDNTSRSYSLYSSLGDYSSIRSGSYKRLLKSYYEEQKSSTSDSNTSNKNNVDSVEKKSLLEVKSSADALAEATKKVSSYDLFEKVDITTKDATTGDTITTKDYNRDAIYKAVKGFVDSYNDTLDSSSEVDTASVLRQTLFMTNQTAAFKKSLSMTGITIGSDNKLSVDEATLKKANINELKTLFTGYNSFASKISQKASAIASASALATGTKTYTKTGSYDLSSLYNRINTSI